MMVYVLSTGAAQVLCHRLEECHDIPLVHNKQYCEYDHNQAAKSQPGDMFLLPFCQIHIAYSWGYCCGMSRGTIDGASGLRSRIVVFLGAWPLASSVERA